MSVNTHKVIFCILPKGVALGVKQALKDDHGIMTTNVSNARGVGKITPLAYRGIAGQSEKEILSVIVTAEQADDIFEYIYHRAEINRPHGGIMFVHGLQQSTEYKLPDVPDEK